MSRPWREVKSQRGAPKRVNTEGLACPNPNCPDFGISDDQIHAAFWGWQAWPGRAHPDLSRSCLPHHLHGPAPSPSLPFENPLSCRVAVVLTALARGLDPSEAPRVAGLPTSDHHEPFSRARARTLRPCTNTRISPPPAPTRAGGRTAHQVALRHTGALAGDRSPHARFCLCLSSAPAHNTWPICSSTLCDRAWPPFCLPLFTSDGLNFSFSASPSACWTVARRRASWAQSPSMAGSGGSDLRPGETKLPAAQAGSGHARDAPWDRGRSQGHVAALRPLWRVEHRLS